MKFSEAIEKVEKAVSNLNMKDKFGNHISGDIGIGAVIRYHEQRWEELNRKIVHKEITPEQYTDGALKMVEEYARFRLKRRVEQALVRVAQ